MLVRIELGSLENLFPNLVVTAYHEGDKELFETWLKANNVLKDLIVFENAETDYHNGYLFRWYKKIRKDLKIEEGKLEQKRVERMRQLGKKII